MNSDVFTSPEQKLRAFSMPVRHVKSGARYYVLYKIRQRDLILERRFVNEIFPPLLN